MSAMSAVLGGAAWLALYWGYLSDRFPVPAGWIGLWFLLAPLVVVPLGLSLIARLSPAIASGALFRLGRGLQLPAAALAAASFWSPLGPEGALWCAGWAAVALLLGVSGLRRLLAVPRAAPGELCLAAGLAYLPVGAAGLVVYRLGRTPLGYDVPIPLLFAVHFHFTTFAGPVLAGALGARLEGSPLRRPFRAVAAGVVLFPLVVAAGFIAYSPVLKLLGVMALAASLIALAALHLPILAGLRPGPSGWLLGTSMASLAAAMALAAIYGVGEYAGRTYLGLDIPRMARTHGVLNGLGFAVAGMTGWLIAAGKPPVEKGARGP